MQITKIVSVFGLAMSLLGCGRANPDQNAAPMESKAKAEVLAEADSSNAFISSSAAVEKSKDSTRRFIRTAELKFKVKSVLQSTYTIEDLASRQGGFVTYTNLASTIDNVTTTPVSADSSLETTYYTVSNTLTIRVPNTKLDTTLKEIAKNIDYLDYRIIKAEDVGLQILANNLTQKRSARNEDRLTNAIENRGKKLKETAAAEELLLNKQEQSDNAKIANLSLTDQIKFSTINLNIYQRQTIKRDLISNYKNIDAYEPGFGSQLIEALSIGWDALLTFFLILARLWALFLLGIVIYFGIRFYRARGKK